MASYIVARANPTAVAFVAGVAKERPEWGVLARFDDYGAAQRYCGAVNALPAASRGLCQPDLAAPFSCDRDTGHPGACHSARFNQSAGRERFASRADQAARYLDAGPGAWDDRGE